MTFCLDKTQKAIFENQDENSTGEIATKRGKVLQTCNFLLAPSKKCQKRKQKAVEKPQ